MSSCKSSSGGSNIIGFNHEATQTSRDIIGEGTWPGHDGATWDKGWCWVDDRGRDMWDMDLVSCHVTSKMSCKVSSRDSVYTRCSLVRESVGAHDDVDVWGSGSEGC